MFGPALLAIALAAATQNPAASVADPPRPGGNDASLNRINVLLARPVRLKITTDRDLPEPTFRIEIHQHPYFTEMPFIWTFGGGGYALTAPGLEHMGGSQLPKSFGGGTDVLPLFMKLKRALDERAAKAEVERALAEFCATHFCVFPR